MYAPGTPALNISRTLAIERIDDSYFNRPGIDQYVVLSMLLLHVRHRGLWAIRAAGTERRARTGSILVSLTSPAAAEPFRACAGGVVRADASNPTPRAAQPIADPAQEKVVAPTGRSARRIAAGLPRRRWRRHWPSPHRAHHGVSAQRTAGPGGITATGGGICRDTAVPEAVRLPPPGAHFAGRR